ncbi:MAG: hypothetical protein H6545_03515 [Bacteroidales bacterium]|jgi:hypothetical protein|nr:hypothetical protein [Bacteroidales bacterium]MDD3735594.1 hypothetical protein [Bacteroidales bacterium]NLD62640.1 hypothetical protein [Bacteroidales bacterium]HNT92801.1 hypothetical protein [Bacteroidales bacterium]HOO66863.1 hypothetical protein [Bacteroidales bacterium]
MKRTLGILFVAAIIMSGCGSSKKQLEIGNYDAAINKAVAELRKKPDNEKEIEILERAMNIALEQDNERVRFLKIEGRANAWDEIYLIYKKMSDRQSAVRTVTPIRYQGRTIEWPYVDYMQEMVVAKKNAADFYYDHGQELMKNGTKESYRQAYAEFVRAREYVGDYPGIDQLMQESRYLGISRAYVTVKNYSTTRFPENFEKELLALDLPRLNSEWVEYHTTLPGEDTQIDYLVSINLRTVAVSPDKQFQRDSLVKATVEDGFEYVKDARGNVLKDSLGNDVKVKKYKNLQCALIQTFQVKECIIEGDVEMQALYPDRTIKKEPIGATSNFEHISARAIGDVNALSPEQKKMLQSGLIEFPMDFEMIMMCSENLKTAIRGFMEANRRYIN